MAVAVTGVALPVLLGLAAGAVLGYGMGVEGWFVGAMLAATSVGITAKLLGDNGLVNTNSARVILGAAVIDDVVGILLLAVLASVVVNGEVSALELLWIVAKALLFSPAHCWWGRNSCPALSYHFAQQTLQRLDGIRPVPALAFAQLAHFCRAGPAYRSVHGGTDTG